MNYSVDYFISKFEKIPEEMWFKGGFGENSIHCALGHCGHKRGHNTDEGIRLWDIFFLNLGTLVAHVNDGGSPEYQQPTPKQRILAALYDIKANQHVDAAKEIINKPELQEAENVF